MLQIVREKFGMFTECQVNRAITSRDMQAHVVHLTDDKFKQMVSGKSLDDCSTFSNGVTNARAIFGPNRPGLRGEIVRQRPERVVPEPLEIPKDFDRLHHFLTLTADVIFDNGLPFG